MSQKIADIVRLRQGSTLQLQNSDGSTADLQFHSLKVIKDRAYLFFVPRGGLERGQDPTVIFRHMVDDEGNRSIWELDQEDLEILQEEALCDKSITHEN